MYTSPRAHLATHTSHLAHAALLCAALGLPPRRKWSEVRTTTVCARAVRCGAVRCGAVRCGASAASGSDPACAPAWRIALRASLQAGAGSLGSEVQQHTRGCTALQPRCPHSSAVARGASAGTQLTSSSSASRAYGLRILCLSMCVLCFGLAYACVVHQSPDVAPLSSSLVLWCIWLSHPPNTRKVGSSILSGITG